MNALRPKLENKHDTVELLQSTSMQPSNNANRASKCASITISKQAFHSGADVALEVALADLCGTNGAEAMQLT